MRGDILLTFCLRCGHLYNGAFDPQLIQYTTSYENSLHHSRVFQKYTRNLVEDLVNRYVLQGKKVLEIGCGQGDFLTVLCERAACTGIGFDPAYTGGAGSPDQGRITVIPDLYSSKYASARPDLVVCRQTLEHIPQPQEMLEEVRCALGERTDAAVFFEVPNVLDHLRSGDIWVFIYEHISYYSPASLAAGFATAGFDVRAVRELFGTLFLGIEARPAPGTARIPADEQSARLREVSLLVDGFGKAAMATMRNWEARFKGYADGHDRVVVWGAGARCTNFLNLVRGSSVVDYVVDINPRKHGTYVSGSGQQIVAPEFLVDYQPDAIVLLNPVYEREISATLAKLGVATTIVGADGRTRRVEPPHAGSGSTKARPRSHNLLALYADTPGAMSHLEGGLVDDEVTFVEAHTYDDAIQAAQTARPDLYVVGHHFDEMHADRLIRFLRSKPWAASTPILVVRALPFQQPPRDEEELKQSYATVGADDYLPLFDEARRAGRDAAVRRFKNAVKTHLRGIDPQISAP